MPGMSGPALAHRLLGRHPSLRVLYMSGYAEEAIERQGSLPAGGELLEKPFTADQLAAAGARGHRRLGVLTAGVIFPRHAAPVRRDPARGARPHG